MALDLPTRDEILERSRADIKAALPQTDPYEVTSVINTLEVSKSSRLSELYDQLNLVSRDTFITTAQGQALIDRAAEQGITRKPATKATGNAIFTGIATSNIPIGTEFQSSDGITYQTT